MKKQFIDLCLKQVKLGGQRGSNLKSSAWAKVREDFNKKVGVNYEQKQFKNFWDMLKKQWNIWKKLISLTGIGKVAQGQTIQMEPERWNEHIKANPDARQFRYKPLPYADKLEQLFGGVTATGDYQFTSANEDNPLDDFGNWPSTSHNPSPTTETFSPPPGPPNQTDLDPVHVQSETDYEDLMSNVRRKRPCPPEPTKNQCDAFVEKIDGVLDKIPNSATSAASYHHGPLPTVADCYASLRQTPGFVLGTPLYVLALRYINIPSNRELWMLEQDPKTRVMLVQSHFSS
ncbi:hypothetical protein QJS04_geneDACA016509 [Acorus gramineus]|uniref:Myb/SANT-like domain-containing protein n=1 Tax=Acorus gramineus TaxID=55184 RepID=A0AAV9B8E1_ACOGR|nr:hypothetical protein QJS04_geneDACA016509 [Acorus gramineus]